MQVGLALGHIVLDGIQLLLPKGALSPNFRPISVVTKWLDGSKCHFVRRYRPWPRPHCVTWWSSSSKKGHSPPQFSAHVYCGQTVTHLSYCWALVRTWNNNVYINVLLRIYTCTLNVLILYSSKLIGAMYLLCYSLRTFSTRRVLRNWYFHIAVKNHINSFDVPIGLLDASGLLLLTGRPTLLNL